MLTLRAGAVPVRRFRGRTQVLLVRAKGTTERVFPKGHLKVGEPLEAAALRELKEEAGVEGRVLGKAGDLEFKSGRETVRAHYLLVRATRSVGDGEKGREPIWVDPRVALTLLTFDNAREMLERLLPLIDRMGPPITPGPKEFDDLLLADFQHLGESLLANEEAGEKRVTFFLTLVTATAGALGYFGDKIEPAYGQGWSLLSAGALLALFVFGAQTLQRVVRRNASTDGFKIRLNRIRWYFARTAGRHRRGFLGFDPDHPGDRDVPAWPWSGRGGWLDTVVLVDAVLLAAVVALLTWALILEARIALTVGTFFIAWLALHRLGAKLHQRRWEKEATRL